MFTSAPAPGSTTAGSGSIYCEDRYVTRGKFSKAKFEENCLAEYARTFPTVCGDLTFYQFPSEQYWAKLFEATPESFIFGFKVPEDITVETWPTHARYGKRAGLRNENFLNADAFAQFFTNRLVRYGNQVGPLIFEFGTFNKKTFAKPADFLAVLDPFLGALPKGFQYAVEIRNDNYLTPQYFEVLASHNVAHVFNAWTRMPELDEQAQLPGAFTADFTVVRALLEAGPGLRRGRPDFRALRPNSGAKRERAGRHEDDRRASAPVEEVSVRLREQPAGRQCAVDHRGRG